MEYNEENGKQTDTETGHKRQRKDNEPQISSKNNRLREEHVSLYKAFRKTSLNHTKTPHHYAFFN